MSHYLKLTFFSAFLVFIAFFSGCKNQNNDVIPDVYVNFQIDLLYDIEFRDLNAIGNHVIVTSATNNWGSRAAGYDNNGIIVYRSLLDEFNAYDRTCPHDYAKDKSSVKVNVEAFSAICPRCSTEYSLSSFGIPVSGPGKYPLKNYNTSFDGRYISVWNR